MMLTVAYDKSAIVMVSVAVRFVYAVFSIAVTVTVALPLPDAADNASHAGIPVIIQLVLDVISKDFASSAGANVSDAGATLKLNSISATNAACDFQICVFNVR